MPRTRCFGLILVYTLFVLVSATVGQEQTTNVPIPHLPTCDFAAKFPAALPASPSLVVVNDYIGDLKEYRVDILKAFIDALDRFANHEIRQFSAEIELAKKQERINEAQYRVLLTEHNRMLTEINSPHSETRQQYARYERRSKSRLESAYQLRENLAIEAGDM